MTPYRVLIVDDEESMRLFLAGVLKGEGYETATAGDGLKAMNLLRENHFDLVLADLKMPHLGGMELLSQIKETYPEVDVVVLTAFGSIETAVEAMKKGAADFLTKPLSSPDQLRLVVKRIRERQSLVRENILMKAQVSRDESGELIANDPLMKRVLELIRLVAPTDSTVLITGESGTGKEVVARRIHHESRRADGPFVAVNCAALPETLLESELFGHEKGAFTGALARKLGRFELAQGGTLFLDEIGEIAPPVQAKLLRVLQEREIQRLGDTRPRRVDVRIIAATNRDLQEAVGSRAFREDLYYRLNVFPIHIPPLRERPGDILPLAEHFLQKSARRAGKRLQGLSGEARSLLTRYHWPGNVREVANLMERALILCSDGWVHPEHLGLMIGSQQEHKGSFTVESKRSLKEIEREAILRALTEHGGNRQKTAEALGISLRTLQYRLKEYGVS